MGPSYRLSEVKVRVRAKHNHVLTSFRTLSLSSSQSLHAAIAVANMRVAVYSPERNKYDAGSRATRLRLHTVMCTRNLVKHQACISYSTKHLAPTRVKLAIIFTPQSSNRETQDKHNNEINMRRKPASTALAVLPWRPRAAAHEMPCPTYGVIRRQSKCKQHV